MIARFLETFFRHKLLILLPAIITPLVVAPFAFVMVKPYYETSAGIWVERPAYVPNNDDWNRYVTPAQNQQERMNELLKTRAFTEDIARRTSLKPLLDSPAGRVEAFEYLGRAIFPLATGSKLLSLRVRTEDPDLTMEIINATVATFRERNQNDRMTQSAAAIGFYEQQLRDADDQVVQTREAVRRYIAANPRAVAGDPNTPANSRITLPTSATDPALSEMLKRLERAEADADRLRSLVEQSKFDATATLEGTDSSLQLMDPPIYPQSAQRERRRLLVFPAAAAAIGLLVSALLLVALTASDRSVRSTADLRQTGRVIGVVPRMGLRKLPRQAGPDTTRRAIAFVAGTTLPALPGATPSELTGGSRMALTLEPRATNELTPDEGLRTTPMEAPRRPLFPEAEELFRGIYTRAGLNAPGIIAVTSAITGEGKTTIALGLAVMVAQDFPERRVLLAEADLRQPVLAADFAVEPNPGLAEALEGVYPVGLGYRETFLPNLQVLPAGEPTPNPSRLLRSSRFAAVLAATRRSFDLVILDAPALLVTSDAALVADQADGTIVVVRSGVTPSPLVNRALELVDAERLRGVVLNGAQSAVPGWIRRIFGL